MSESKKHTIPHIPNNTVLNNRYTICALIGYGGFGVTYKAFDPVMQIDVAIKEYFPGDTSHRNSESTSIISNQGEAGIRYQRGLERFIKEARMLARGRDYESVVRIYDVFEENSTAYIVMEYIDGMTLRELIDQNGIYEPKEAVTLLMPILETLCILHDEGIIHSDLAPDNIMVSSQGIAKIIDFGATRYAIGANEKGLTMMVKDGYTPQELYLDGSERTGANDVYAIAGTLYTMLTGIVPANALSRKVSLEANEKDILVPIRNYQAIPRRINIALHNAMNVRLEERTPTMRDFIRELSGNGKIVLIGSRGSGRKFRGRWLLACVLLLVFAGSAYASLDIVKNLNRSAKEPSSLNEEEVLLSKTTTHVSTIVSPSTNLKDPTKVLTKELEGTIEGGSTEEGKSESTTEYSTTDDITEVSTKEATTEIETEPIKSTSQTETKPTQGGNTSSGNTSNKTNEIKEDEPPPVAVPNYHLGDIKAMNALIEAHPEMGLEKAPADGSSVPKSWDKHIVWKENAALGQVIRDIRALVELTKGELVISGFQHLENLETQKALANQYFGDKELIGPTVVRISDCPKLWTVIITGYNVEELLIGDLPSLTWLFCDNNTIRVFEIASAKQLHTIYCSGNKLKTLDVTKFSNLNALQCEENELTEINIRGLKYLEGVNVSNNKIKNLDMTGANNIRGLLVYGNPIEEIDGSKLLMLERLTVSNIKNLNIKNCKRLTTLEIVDNEYLVNLDLAGAIHLENLRLTNLPKLKNLDIRGCTSLFDIFIRNTGIENVLLDDLPILSGIVITDSKVGSLDLSRAPKLWRIELANNQLRNLELGDKPALVALIANNNLLEKLDVSKCVELEGLDIQFNNIKEIDIRKCPRLMNVWVDAGVYSIDK